MSADNAPPKLQYHQKVFDFLGRDPVLGDDISDSVKALETLMDKPVSPSFVKRPSEPKLPSSVIEWFSLKDATTLIDPHRDHNVLPIDYFHMVRNEKTGEYEAQHTLKYPNRWLELENGSLMYVIHYHQDVAACAIDLLDSDDPVVWGMGEAMWEKAMSNWQPIALTFSDFIYAVVWTAYSWQNSYYAGKRINPLTLAELGFLDTTYGCVSTAAISASFSNQYRFGNREIQIMVGQERIERGKRQASFSVRTETPEALEAVLRDMWHMSNISEQLQQSLKQSWMSDTVRAIVEKLLAE